jgi:hypothetical protein
MTRILTRVVMAVVALIFIMGALVFAHIAAWHEIRTDLNQSYLITTAILGCMDLTLAVVLLFLASRSSPSRVEVEALDVRRKAIAGISSAMSVTQMALPLVRIASGFARRRRG